MIKVKRKAEYYHWVELNVNHLKNRSFLTLGRQFCPFATTKQETLF